MNGVTCPTDHTRGDSRVSGKDNLETKRNLESSGPDCGQDPHPSALGTVGFSFLGVSLLARRTAHLRVPRNCRSRERVRRRSSRLSGH